MYLKNKWRSLNIKKKIFIETTTLLIVAFMLIFLVVYFVLPKVYQNYKEIIANKSIDKLIDVLENESNINLEDTLNTYVYSSNMKIFLINAEDKIVYPIRKEDKHGYSFFDETSNRTNTLEIRIDFTRIVYIKTLDKNYELLVHIPMNFAEDTSMALIYFIPFFIIFSVIIATIMSVIYSRALSNPLIHINNIAKSMARLDFTRKFKINGNDELNQLCESLNEMSISLQETIIKLEEANKSLRDDIERKNMYDKQRRDFIATISHELKSPITIISGQLEGMIHNIGVYKDRDKYLKKSFDVTQEMKMLVDELLELAKYEKHGFEVHKSKVEMISVINEILAVQGFFIKEKDIKVELVGNFEVKVDISLIKKALNNLVNNSIKYSPKGSLVKITLVNDKYPTIYIENFGVTIEADELEEIFTAFFRIDKSRNRNTGGSGLGLYIVKKIFDAHGNIRYTVKSENNSVLFKITFI